MGLALTSQLAAVDQQETLAVAMVLLSGGDPRLIHRLSSSRCSLNLRNQQIRGCVTVSTKVRCRCSCDSEMEQRNGPAHLRSISAALDERGQMSRYMNPRGCLWNRLKRSIVLSLSHPTLPSTFSTLFRH